MLGSRKVKWLGREWELKRLVLAVTLVEIIGMFLIALLLVYIINWRIGLNMQEAIKPIVDLIGR